MSRTKVCKKCGKEKLLFEFSIGRAEKGRHSYCKKCRREMRTHITCLWCEEYKHHQYFPKKEGTKREKEKICYRCQSDPENFDPEVFDEPVVNEPVYVVLAPDANQFPGLIKPAL